MDICITHHVFLLTSSSFEWERQRVDKMDISFISQMPMTDGAFGGGQELTAESLFQCDGGLWSGKGGKGFVVTWLFGPSPATSQGHTGRRV